MPHVAFETQSADLKLMRFFPPQFVRPLQLKWEISTSLEAASIYQTSLCQPWEATNDQPWSLATSKMYPRVFRAQVVVLAVGHSLKHMAFGVSGLLEFDRFEFKPCSKWGFLPHLPNRGGPSAPNRLILDARLQKFLIRFQTLRIGRSSPCTCSSL